MILNRVLMKANPNFFFLCEKEQEVERLCFFNNSKNIEIFDSIIGKELFGKPLEPDDFSEFSNLDYGIYNKMRISLCGYGENKVFINESFMFDKNLLAFENVFDYLEQYRIETESQNKSSTEDDVKKLGSRSKFNIKSNWIQLLDKDELVYIHLDSATNYIISDLSEFVRDIVRGLYPYKLIKNKDVNDTSSLAAFGFKRDANGKEKHFLELTRRSFALVKNKYEEINKYIEENDLNCTFIIPNEIKEKDEVKFYILLPNESVAKKVRWNTFMDDAKSLESNFSVFDELIEKMKFDVKTDIQSIFEDIEDNFIPDKVVPIRKMKFSVSQSAIDSLSKLIEKKDKDN